MLPVGKFSRFNIKVDADQNDLLLMKQIRLELLFFHNLLQGRVILVQLELKEINDFIRLHHEYADCIVTLGWGDMLELHLRNKKAIGEAAARCAIARLNRETPPTGPVFEHMTKRNNALELVFSGGKHPKTGVKIAGFAIAGENGRAFRAQAEVIGANAIRVAAEEVTEPAKVWYA